MFQLLCSILFDLQGWTYVSNIPDEIKSFVFIGAPHTSNHDIIPTLVIARNMKRNTKFVIKKEWLRFPFGLFLKNLGAIGIDRSKIKTQGQSNTTDLMAQLFLQHKDLVLMISPEGTRKANDQWKSGFYHIATKAKVPIVLGYADYEKKVAGLGKVIFPKNYEEDMKEIMNFYRQVKGKKTENFKLDKKFQ